MYIRERIKIKEMNKKEEKAMKYIIFMSLVVFGIYIYELLDVILINSNLIIYRVNMYDVLNIILSVMGMISCKMCYESNNKSEVILVYMMYMLALIDGWSINIQSKIAGLEGHLHIGILSSTLGIILAFISISNNEKLKHKIAQNQYKVFIAIMVLTYVFTYIESHYIRYGSIKMIEAFSLFLMLMYLFFAVFYFAKSMESKEYVYGLLGATMLMFLAHKNSNTILALNPNIQMQALSVSSTYIGYVIFIMGVLIEFNKNAKYNRILRNELEMFYSISENSKSTNILIVDYDLNIKYANKRAMEEYDKKHKKDEDESNFIKDIIYHGLNEEDRKDITKSLVDTGYWHNTLTKADGAIYDIYAQHIKQKNKAYILIQYTDITQRYENDKLALKYQFIKQEEEFKNKFFANLSHELKTPINVLYSTNQLLNQKVEDKNFKCLYQKYSEMMNINCKRLLRLVNNIVDVSKLETKYIKPIMQNYEIISLVEDISLSVVNYANMKNIQLQFDTDIEELIIKCDPDMIERIMLNLLSNSIKFTNENGKIDVDIKHDEQYVYISVEDNGIGVPKDIQDKIFERFVQADKSLRRNYEGSGIGLNIVYMMVENIGGNISIESDGRSGSKFTVRLPNDSLEKQTQIKPNLGYVFNEENVKLELSDIYELYERA